MCHYFYHDKKSKFLRSDYASWRIGGEGRVSRKIYLESHVKILTYIELVNNQYQEHKE